MCEPTFSPSGPGGPIAPMCPGVPVIPCLPSFPFKPGGPEIPGGPISPCSPSAPGPPGNPCGPGYPVTPSKDDYRVGTLLQLSACSTILLFNYQQVKMLSQLVNFQSMSTHKIYVPSKRPSNK